MRPPRTLLTLACVVAAALAASGCGGGGGGAGGGAGTVVWAIGDGGAGTDAAKQVAAQVAKDDPKAVIFLGDVYEGGTAAEFASNFGAVYGDLVKRMWATPGNHDWANHEEGYDPFWHDALGERLPHHYARDAGGWEILSVNSETPDDPEQLAWLRGRASGGGDCRLAFWHRPRFNAGMHRDEEQNVAQLWDAVAGRAAIVLNGHDHDMQRFKPVKGTVEYVSGAGGKSHYAVDDADPRLAFSDDQTYGALRIALTPGKAELRFVAADGSVLDRSTVTCEG